MSKQGLDYSEFILVIQEMDKDEIILIFEAILKNEIFPSKPLVAKFLSKTLVNGLLFLISKLNKEVKNYVSQGTSLLHKRLAGYSPIYKLLTQDIIEKIFLKFICSVRNKTITINFNDALKDINNINKFIEDDLLFKDLNEEQRVAVSLLYNIGQQNHEIAKIINYLNQTNQPKIQLTMGNRTKSKEGKAGWFCYTDENSEYIRRQNDNILDEFINDNRKFLWIAVEGDGGSGKSRFAFEHMKNNQKSWRVGFYEVSEIDIHNIPNWIPDEPYIITIDYIQNNIKKVVSLLMAIMNISDSLLFPIRIILIDRNIDRQQWWLEEMSRHQYKLIDNQYEKGIIRIENDNTLYIKEFFKSWLLNLNNNYPIPLDSDNEFWQKLLITTNNGLPLYIGIAAYYYSKNGRDLLLLKNSGLLDSVYVRNIRLYKDKYRSQYKFALRLILISILVGGFKEEYFNIDNLRVELGIDDYLEIKSISQEICGNQEIIIKPDILSEYFVYKEFSCTNNQCYLEPYYKNILSLALSLNSFNFIAFTKKLSDDFPFTLTLIQWLNFFNTIEKFNEVQLNNYTGILINISYTYKNTNDTEIINIVLTSFDNIYKKYSEKYLSSRYMSIIINTVEFYHSNKMVEDLKSLHKRAKNILAKQSTVDISMAYMKVLSNIISLRPLNDATYSIDEDIEEFVQIYQTNKTLYLDIYCRTLVNLSLNYGNCGHIDKMRNCIQQLENIFEINKEQIFANYLAMALTNAISVYTHIDDNNESINNSIKKIYNLLSIRRSFTIVHELSKSIKNSTLYALKNKDIAYMSEQVSTLKTLSLSDLNIEIQSEYASSLVNQHVLYLRNNQKDAMEETLEKLQELCIRYTEPELITKFTKSVYNTFYFYQTNGYIDEANNFYEYLLFLADSYTVSAILLDEISRDITTRSQ